MKSPIFKVMLVGFVIYMLSSGLCLLDEALAGAPLKLYYEENAQVELISPEGSRVLIDVHDPSLLSSPPTSKDVLLTTHNHGDHRRLDFVSSFPGKQLDVKTGDIMKETSLEMKTEQTTFLLLKWLDYGLPISVILGRKH